MGYGIFLAAVFLFVVFFSAALLLSIYQGRIQVKNRLQMYLFDRADERAVELAISEWQQEKTKLSLRQRLLVPLWTQFRSLMLGKMSPQKAKDLEKMLADAGSPFGITAVDYRIIQLLLAVGFFLVIFLPFIWAAKDMGQLALLSLAAGFFGGMYPTYYLKAKKKQRIIQIQKMMPDFFDMVNVSIEAGMGLDAAIAKVCKRMEGPLSNEFLQSLDEMKLGKSRKEAFSDLRQRIPSENFQSVMSALIQADQLGIGMAKVLRAQTHRIREQRRQAAKEKAMKAPVKMMIPMVIFMFPTLFIILLGPLVVQLVTKWL
jgi:tight adherence protein C